MTRTIQLGSDFRMAKSMNRNSIVHRRARAVARAAGSYELARSGARPTCVTIVTAGELMVVTLQAVMPECDAGDGVRPIRQSAIERSLDGLRRSIRGVCGIDLRSAIWSADPSTASYCKTLATHAELDVFRFGQGIPLLGVPIDAHLYADGPRAESARGIHAEGTGSECRRDPIVIPSD